MNFYRIISELFMDHPFNSYDPPEAKRFFEIVFAPTRSKAKYKFYKKYRKEVGCESFRDFVRVSIRKMDLKNPEDAEFIQRTVWKNEVL